MPIRVLIVDDERLSRLKLRDLLEKENDIEIVGEAGSGQEAVNAIKKLKPDLVFLDVQMPELDGFDVIEAIGLHHMPHIIFATAYDQYALQAFNIHALDYLLKPFDQERFRDALTHVRRSLWTTEVKDEFKNRLKKLIKDVQSETPYPKRFLIQSNRKMYILKTNEVEWVEASGNYTIFHTLHGEHSLRETMDDMEKKLDPQQFIRANRSVIINLEFIKEIQPYFHGEFIVFLKSNQKVIISRTYRENFKKIFDGQS
jgi:two-component system LytT family response regulator